MIEDTPTRSDIHAELERASTQFRELCEGATPADLARLSNGTRWTNRELLFHMLFGYLITRNLRHVVRLITRAPRRVQNGFATALDATTPLFHTINYWGSCGGGRTIAPERMADWCDRTVSALHRHLDAESDADLRRSMSFPTRWDPYFASRMTLRDVYHYATLHFDHHLQQLSITSSGDTPISTSSSSA